VNGSGRLSVSAVSALRTRQPVRNNVAAPQSAIACALCGSTNNRTTGPVRLERAADECHLPTGELRDLRNSGGATSLAKHADRRSVKTPAKYSLLICEASNPCSSSGIERCWLGCKRSRTSCRVADMPFSWDPVPRCGLRMAYTQGLLSSARCEWKATLVGRGGSTRALRCSSQDGLSLLVVTNGSQGEEFGALFDGLLDDVEPFGCNTICGFISTYCPSLFRQIP
jgi:hypothetical protein